MTKRIEEKEMYTENVVSIKVEKEERFYPKQFGGPTTKIINRTYYLKRCWL